MHEQHILVTGSLILGDKILLLRRSKKQQPSPGFYEIPTGFVQYGESLETALGRIYYEQTHLHVAPRTIFATRSELVTTADGHEVQHVVIEYLVDLAIGEEVEHIAPSVEYDDYLFVDLKMLVQLTNVSAEKRQSIRAILKSL